MDIDHFRAAREAAQRGAGAGGIPIGAVLTRAGAIIATAHNERVQQGDPTAHAEIACLRTAGRQGTYRDTVLYSTLAPCAMCTGAIIQFQIPKVIVGEDETFPGELDLLRARGVEVVVLGDKECVDLMRSFQQANPGLWAEDIGR